MNGAGAGTGALPSSPGATRPAGQGQVILKLIVGIDGQQSEVDAPCHDCKCRCLNIQRSGALGAKLEGALAHSGETIRPPGGPVVIFPMGPSRSTSSMDAGRHCSQPTRHTQCRRGRGSSLPRLFLFVWWRGELASMADAIGIGPLVDHNDLHALIVKDMVLQSISTTTAGLT